MPEDENITSTDLEPRFYQHLEHLGCEQQIVVINNTEPPAEYAASGIHFTANEKWQIWAVSARQKGSSALD